MLTHHQKPGRRAAGFSLVELLVVVAIIVLLIGLLVPALSRIRNSAKSAASQATLATIDAGLATFKADNEFGGTYPPSHSDDTSSGGIADPGPVDDPFSPPGAQLSDRLSDNQGVSGAALLVMALAGADLQGTPGFLDLNGNGEWSDDTGGGVGSSGGLYAKVGATDPTPFNRRVGPYVDLEKISISPALRTLVNQSNAPEYQLKANKGVTMRLPVFLDAFGFPILYWRADRSAKQAIATTSGGGTPGVYTFEDNRFFTGDANNSGQYPGFNLGAGADHKIARGAPGGYPSGFQDPTDLDIANATHRESFLYYTHDPNVTVNLLPKNRDSYLTITPGPDGLYGTGDDVTNFQKNR